MTTQTALLDASGNMIAVGTIQNIANGWISIDVEPIGTIRINESMVLAMVPMPELPNGAAVELAKIDYYTAGICMVFDEDHRLPFTLPMESRVESRLAEDAA